MKPELALAKSGGPLQTFLQWRQGIRIAQIAHLRAAASCQRQHKLLGVPVTILTAIASTTIFSSLGETKQEKLLIVAGIISALSASLSSIQTFMNYPELAVKHRAAGSKFGKLRRQVDEIIGTESSEDQVIGLLKEVREEWGKIEDEAPTVAQKFIDQAKKEVLLSKDGKSSN